MPIMDEAFATFTPNPIFDARRRSAVLIAISQPNPKAVQRGWGGWSACGTRARRGVS
jgi:predicted lactoylglutathione lyase